MVASARAASALTAPVGAPDLLDRKACMVRLCPARILRAIVRVRRVLFPTRRARLRLRLWLRVVRVLGPVWTSLAFGFGLFAPVVPALLAAGSAAPGTAVAAGAVLLVLCAWGVHRYKRRR